MTVALISDSSPHREPDERIFHLSLDEEPRCSPQERAYRGGRFQANGISRDKVVRFLRRLADRLERGETIEQIASP